MKTLLTLTAAIIGGIALPTLLMAGPTETITGCATVAVEGSNYTTFVDPTCYSAPEAGKGLDPRLIAALFDAIEDDEEEPAAD